MAESILAQRVHQLRDTHHRVFVVGRVLTAAGCFAAAFLLAGFSETWGLLQLVTLAALVLAFRSHLLVVALLGTVAGYGVVMLAPGNAVRMAQGAALGLERHSLPDAIRITFEQTTRFIGQTLVWRWPACVIAFAAGYWLAGERCSKWASAGILALFAGALALITLTLFPGALLAGIYSYRNFIPATFILIVALAGIGGCIKLRGNAV